MATRPARAQRITIAVLLGMSTMAVLAFFATLFQTPGLEGPVEIARIAVVVAVLGVTALPLVWWDDTLGYAAAGIAGAVAIIGIALYLAGTFGPTRVAPAAYLFAVLGGLLVLTSVVWPGEDDRRDPTRSPFRNGPSDSRQGYPVSTPGSARCPANREPAGVGETSPSR